MRDDQIRGRLIESNPWWNAASGGSPTAWAEDDPVLRSRSAYDLGYRADVFSDIAVAPIDDKLVVVRGPRRVGKSVAVKDLAVALCARPDVDVRQIIYLPTDGMRAGDLNRVAVLGRELTRSVGLVPRVWLLDEVTGVTGWTESLKYLRDNTPLASDTVICTGSSWEARAEVERDLLAGRAGTGSSSTRRTRLLLPMRFRDVVTATGRGIPMPSPVGPWKLQAPASGVAALGSELHTEELDLAWQAYLTSGGFPRAVAEHHRSGQVGEAFINDLAAWLHGDVDPHAPFDSVPLLLAELTRRSTSPLNRADCANALGYSTRQAFDVRLARLTRSFALLWCHQIDGSARRVAGAQSKLYIADSLLAWLGPRLRSGLPAPDMTQLSEAALGTALAAAVDQLQPGRWVADDAIGYARTGKGNEIDFAPVAVPTAAGDARTTPVESKWVARGWRSEARVIEAKYAMGVVGTRNILDLDHRVWAMPAPLVALLLG